MILVMVSPAKAELMPGKELYDLCVPAAATACVIYITGATDMMSAFQPPTGEPTICLPSQLTSGQAKDAVIRWFAKHRVSRQASAAQLVRTALAEMWPCGPTP